MIIHMISKLRNTLASLKEKIISNKLVAKILGIKNSKAALALGVFLSLFIHSKNFRSSVILIVITLSTSVFGYINLRAYNYESVINAIQNNQAVMVNVETDEIFAGAVYKEPSQEGVEDVAEEVPSEPSMGAQTNEMPKTPLDYRSAQPQNVAPAKVALVVTGLGLSKNMTLDALDLPAKLTLGFSPYAADISDWINQAVAKDFEVLLQLPMQPSDYQVNDPGPYAMLHNLSHGENLTRLDELMSRSEKVVGFYTPINETFSSSRADITPVLNHIREKDYLLLYGNGSNIPTMTDLCDSTALECLYSTGSIDDDLVEDKIKKRLLLLEAEANQKGYAIGYLNAYPLTISTVKKWMDEINPKHISVVPASTLLPPRAKNTAHRSVPKEDIGLAQPKVTDLTVQMKKGETANQKAESGEKHGEHKEEHKEEHDEHH